MSTTPPPSEEVAQDFRDALEDLKINSRPEISNLTIIAKENTEHAQAISNTLEEHINTTRPEFKLPALYVLDSIVKNVGTPYTVYLGRNLYKTFMGAYTLVDNPTRRAMEGLLKTWKQPVPESTDTRPVFSHELTRQIENALIRFRTKVLSQQRTTSGAGPGNHQMMHRPPLAGAGAFQNPYNAPPPGYPPGYPPRSSSTPQPLPGAIPTPPQQQHGAFPGDPRAQMRSPRPNATGTPTPQNQREPSAEEATAQLGRDMEPLIDATKGVFAANPYDALVQRRLQALLDLQQIIKGGRLSVEDVGKIRKQLVELAGKGWGHLGAQPGQQQQQQGGVGTGQMGLGLQQPPQQQQQQHPQLPILTGLAGAAPPVMPPAASTPLNLPFLAAAASQQQRSQQHTPVPAPAAPAQTSTPLSLPQLLAQFPQRPPSTPTPSAAPSLAPPPPQHSANTNLFEALQSAGILPRQGQAQPPPTQQQQQQQQPAPQGLPMGLSSLLAGLTGPSAAGTPVVGATPLGARPATGGGGGGAAAAAAAMGSGPDDTPQLTAASLARPRQGRVDRELYPSAVRACQECGRRFRVEPRAGSGQAGWQAAVQAARELKARHLDWHFRVKTKLAEENARGLQRDWYVDEREWIHFREADSILLPSDAADPSGAGASALVNAAATTAAASASARLSSLSPAPGADPSSSSAAAAAVNKASAAAGKQGGASLPAAASASASAPSAPHVPVPTDPALRESTCWICHDGFRGVWLDEAQDWGGGGMFLYEVEMGPTGW
ncbi:hypothetical protein BDY21DRAFT_374021 [Lineolata rhizophorae]|uniref:CID domain-containing protein n=1 Tax=Lineolata rhizophorae TaxID=578093 RepID=A0A6A6NSH0_9PEZI|nr:hypothetical protein BDY21DRAFT_374021 [Lineolata rhizophorae]